MADTFSMRQKLSESAWNEIRTAYASGIGLREIARNMGVPEGTVLARAKREGWTQEIATAKAKAQKPDAEQSGAITPAESAAITMAERGQRHLESMAGVAEKVVPYIAGLPPGEILDRIDKVEKADRVARRTYGLDAEGPRTNLVSIHIAPPFSLPKPVIDISPDNL